MRILIVEDEFKLSEMVSDRLRKEKYTVDVANDGEDGLYKALDGIYDLIILDPPTFSNSKKSIINHFSVWNCFFF